MLFLREKEKPPRPSGQSGEQAGALSRQCQRHDAIEELRQLPDPIPLVLPDDLEDLVREPEDKEAGTFLVGHLPAHPATVVCLENSTLAEVEPPIGPRGISARVIHRSPDIN